MALPARGGNHVAFFGNGSHLGGEGLTPEQLSQLQAGSTSGFAGIQGATIPSGFNPWTWNVSGFGPNSQPPGGINNNEWLGPNPWSGAGSGGGFGGGGGGGASAGTAHAFTGQASLIDTTEPIYQLNAPQDWLSGMLSRGKQYLGSQTQEATRLMGDQATRQGVSMSSPAFSYMQNDLKREETKSLANMQRDAELAWTLPAADRRAGALGQNAASLTEVSMGNADIRTRVSMANASNQTQVSMSNSQLAESIRTRLQQYQMFQQQFAANQQQQQWANLFALYSAGSGATQPIRGGGNLTGAIGNGIGAANLVGSLYNTGKKPQPAKVA